MPIKKLSVSVHCILVASLLQACGGKDRLDVYEQLERPPQIAITPSAEVTTLTDTKLVSDGLGDKIKKVGTKTKPMLRLQLDFDNTWLLLDKAFRHLKIAVTDHDREQGHYLVNFNAKSPEAEGGVWSTLTGGLFTDNTQLRKYQLSVMLTGEYTDIIAKDIGAVTTEADPDAHEEEVVDKKIKKAADSELQLLTLLYTNLHDGFEDDEKQRSKGFFE